MNPYDGLIFAGMSALLCAFMTMLTPHYMSSMREVVRLGSMTIVLLLLGVLLMGAGIVLAVNQ